MRVTVFGRKATVKKLSKRLIEEGVEVTTTPDGLAGMLCLRERAMPDLAIVDSQSEAVEAACREVKQTPGTPLVLTINHKRANWRRLQPLGADGYLPDGGPDRELVARLRSVLRRFQPVERTDGGCQP